MKETNPEVLEVATREQYCLKKKNRLFGVEESFHYCLSGKDQLYQSLMGN